MFSSLLQSNWEASRHYLEEPKCTSVCFQESPGLWRGCHQRSEARLKCSNVCFRAAERFQGYCAVGTRQWPEESDFVTRFCMMHQSNNTQPMQESHAFRPCKNHTQNTCNSCVAVCFLTHATCKNVWHKSYTSGHCQLGTTDSCNCSTACIRSTEGRWGCYIFIKRQQRDSKDCSLEQRASFEVCVCLLVKQQVDCEDCSGEALYCSSVCIRVLMRLCGLQKCRPNIAKRTFWIASWPWNIFEWCNFVKCKNYQF